MFLTIITFIIILALLVLSHELGHFLTARAAGMKVEEFGFGFPPRIFGIKKGQTLYSINWIPLGGFVKIKGENGEARDESDSFGSKKFSWKALVLAAGVLMNLVFAWVVLSIGLMVGLPAAISPDDVNSHNVSNIKVQIAGVIQSSPADTAGLKPGDNIMAINQAPISLVEDLQNYVKAHQDQELNLSIERHGQPLSPVKITPQVIEQFGQSKVLGVNLVQIGVIRYNFFVSWYEGLKATGNLIWQIIYAFYSLISRLVVGAGVSADLSGPVGVAVITGQMVDMGFRYVLQFAAVLSINLAVINFFPFPALDGGRFWFVVLEKLRGKPNNQKIENMIHNLGFALLMLLVLVITYRDVIHYGGGLIDKVRHFF